MATWEMQDVKRLFDNSVSVGLACVVALLLLTSGLSYWNTRQLVRDAKWVAHSYEVQSATSAVLLAMVDAETGQRGFLITGQDKFLEPYDSALARLEDQVAQLKDLTVDNQEQQARVSQLEELIQSRLESMQHGLALRRQNAEEATLWVASGAGKSKMDALRDLVSTIQTTENNLLQARQSQSRQTYRLAVISGLTAAAMALITLGAFSWLLHRSLLVRQEAADILHEQREGFRLTLACIGDGLITTDVEGRVTSLNPVAEALTGWTTSEAHGQPLTTVFQIVNEETRAPVINPVFKALQEGVVVGLANHTVLISKDGTERPIDDSAAPIRGLDLVVKGCVLVFRDVTERQRTEAALGRSEQGLRFHSQILAQVNDVVGAIDNDQKILYLNAAGERLYGVKASEVVGHPLSDLYERRWPSPEYEAEALATLKETGQAQWEVIHATPDGRELQVESKIAVFRDNDGQPLGLIAAVRDVTAQKLATEELRANQHFLERVTDITPGVIHVFDLEKQLSVYVNRSVATVLGYSPQDIEDLGTQVVQALMHPDDLPRFEVHQQSLRRLPDHETLTFEYRVLDQSGQWHWFHSRDTVFARNAKGEVSRYIGMALDITEQKRIEEQLQQSERSFRAIFEQSAVGKAQISAATGRYVRVNQKFCSLTGYSEAELKERTPADITWEADRNLTETGYSKLFQGETSLFELEKRFLRKDGKVAWALVNSTLMRDAESRPDRTITVIQDIHARKQAELELQESQQQFHTLVDAMPQLAWIAHPDGYIYWYNQRWYTYTGTTPEQMEGWGWQSVHDLEILPDVLELWNASIATTEPFEMTFPIRGADGVMRPFLTRIVPLKDEQGCVRRWIGTNTDVSVLKEVADSLRASEEFNRSVLESSPDCVNVMDGEGRLQFINANGKRQLEIDDVAHYLGQPWWELWPEADRGRVRDAVERAQCGETVTFQALAPTAKGNLKWWEVIVTPGSGRDAMGHASRLVSVSRDITVRKQAEEGLRQNAELFARLVEQAPSGMYVVDAEFRLQQVNALAAPVFSTIQPLIGRDFSEIMHILWGETVGDEIAKIFRHTWATGEHYLSPRFVERRADIGVEQAYEWEIQRVTMADGQHGVVCYFQEITERQRAEQVLRDSEALTRLATEATAVGIWEWNLLKNTMHWDKQLFQIYGIEPTPDGYVNYIDWSGALLPEDLPHSERILQDTIRSCGNSRREFRIRRRSDGAQRDIEAVETVRTNAHGQAGWVVGTNLDVTARKRMEEDLRMTAAELSESSRRKDEFLAILAHELRNPLAPIRTGLEVLRLHADANKTVQAATSMMSRQIDQMVRLVDDLLDLSRVSRGKIELRKERVELATIIQHAVEAAQPAYDLHHHQLTVSLPPEAIVLDADPTRLVQVVGNLLTNACKFTKDGGQVSLTVETDGGGQTGRPEEAIIRVRDNGIGIPAEQLPRIFQMFVQLDSSLERSVSGLGIGLALVKSMIELHQGQVEVHSAGVGQGSEFVIRIPAQQIVPQSVSVSATSDDTETQLSAATLRVLVVDDNIDAAEALEMLLRMLGYEAKTANDGLEAVEAASTFHPHVVLLDIGLPKLNGHEVARHIRAQPWGQAMVLIALTGWGQDADRQKTLSAGFNAHLVKPVDLQVLEQMLVDIGDSKPVSRSEA